jgi:putative intracellular protease/amidase
MHKKLLYLFALAAAIFVSGGTKAQAQLADTVETKVPFEFHAAGTDFPAGTYTIRSISTAENSLMEIQSADGKKAAVFETENSDADAAAKNDELIFDKTGDNYVLSQIVDADEGTGVEVFNPNYSSKRAKGQRRIFGFIHL